ncbi:MAG: hypothetical protein GY811_28920 [Myxococcales bacterium]|nr:hypothetical protein [Myxococcales bacterium]
MRVCRCAECRARAEDVNITVFGRDRWEGRRTGEVEGAGQFHDTRLEPTLDSWRADDLARENTRNIPNRLEEPELWLREAEGDIPYNLNGLPVEQDPDTIADQIWMRGGDTAAEPDVEPAPAADAPAAAARPPLPGPPSRGAALRRQRRLRRLRELDPF